MAIKHLDGICHGITISAPYLKDAVSTIDVKDTRRLCQSFQVMSVLANHQSDVVQKWRRNGQTHIGAVKDRWRIDIGQRLPMQIPVVLIPHPRVSRMRWKNMCHHCWSLST